MPRLVTKITAEILPFYNGSVSVANSIIGNIKMGSYLKLNSLEAFLQNFSKTKSTEKIKTPELFGLKNQYNLPIVTLNISY